MDSTDLTRLAYVLKMMCEMVISMDLEHRVGNLEQTSKRQAGLGLRGVVALRKQSA